MKVPIWLGSKNYLCIPGNKSSMEILGFSLQTSLSCWGKEWWMYRQTICCYRWNRTVSGSLACGSIRKKNTSVLQLLILKRLTVVSSSCKTWSYSDIATQKMMAVTSSKQWIHFLRSERWPPTSNSLETKEGFLAYARPSQVSKSSWMNTAT